MLLWALSDTLVAHSRHRWLPELAHSTPDIATCHSRREMGMGLGDPSFPQLQQGPPVTDREGMGAQE